MMRSLVSAMLLVFALAWAGTVDGRGGDHDDGSRDLGGLVMIVWSDGRTPKLFSSEEFELAFGAVRAADDRNLISNGESGEGIVPTPAPPAGDPGFEPGDQVAYNRAATREGADYGRITVYEYGSHGDWFRIRNDFRALAGTQRCRTLPCPPQFSF